MDKLGPILVGLAIAGLIAFVIIFSRDRSRRDAIRDRLSEPPKTEEELKKSPIQLLQDDDAGWARTLVDFVFLGGVADWYSGMFRRAGYFSNRIGPTFLASMILATGALWISAYLIPLDVSRDWPVQPRETGILLVLTMFLWLIGTYVVYRMVMKYRRRIELDLPFWLDLHTSLVEGGVGFDEAITLICSESQFMNRPIFIELQATYRQISLGSSRTDSLRQMAARLQIETLGGVIGAIAQGEEMGAGMVDTLRGQAEMVRNKVAEEAQNRAQRLPVEMVFPMALGVLPAIFLVTLAPPLITLFKFMGSLIKK